MGLRKRLPPECANCGTERYPLKARGCCIRCYALLLRIDRIQRGAPGALGSLGEYLRGRRDEKERIARLKAGLIRQFRERLEFLRLREEQRRSGVDGLTIEYLLRGIAKRAGARRDVNYNTATPIDHTFPPKQKRFLFSLLLNIEERLPWKPNLMRALEGS